MFKQTCLTIAQSIGLNELNSINWAVEDLPDVGCHLGLRNHIPVTQTDTLISNLWANSSAGRQETTKPLFFK